jgi:hypothetical protein
MRPLVGPCLPASRPPAHDHPAGVAVDSYLARRADGREPRKVTTTDGQPLANVRVTAPSKPGGLDRKAAEIAAHYVRA